MNLNKAIQMLEAEYERAKQTEYVRNPLAYALYQVWKKADASPPKRERRCIGMNWLEIAVKMVEQNNDGVKFAPLSNIAGADIKFDKGYGTIKINIPSDVADDLTNGSHKYVGGFLLLDRETYEHLKGGEG